MKISVITVCFNSIATIADTLASVGRQEHVEIEHIVIDGGSTDGTLAVIRSHATAPFRLVSEPDKGIYDAMNKGLSLASGDVVGFLNADDIFESATALSRIAGAVSAGADAVYGDLIYVGASNPEIVVRYWRSGGFRRSRLRFGWMPPHPTFYARRSLLHEVGAFDTQLRVAADYDMMLRCLTRPGLVVSYLPEVLVRMRLGGASNASSGAMLRKSREDLLVMRKHRVGGWFTLASKNLRKLPQFLERRRP